jgi:carboxymethylenebutenolidase
MSRKDTTIPTPDGEARASVITPDSGAGPWPAVIFFMDGPGIRPALFEMASEWRTTATMSCCPTCSGASRPMSPST